MIASDNSHKYAWIPGNHPFPLNKICPCLSLFYRCYLTINKKSFSINHETVGLPAIHLLCPGLFKNKGVKLILHARMPGWNRWWGGWLNSLAICVWCSSVVVILFGIIGFGDLGWYLTCSVTELPNLPIERGILTKILVLDHPNNVELYSPGCGQFLQPLDIGLQ